MKSEKIINARKINKMRLILGLVICSVVIAITFVTLILNAADIYNEKSPESGLGTLRMFTTLSNILAATTASLCIPFQIDGLRRNRYKLPKWIVILMYIGTAAVFLTFFVAITVISAAQGFKKAMFAKSNLFMHTISPIAIFLLFVLGITDHKVKFKESLLALIPIYIYGILYIILVFVAQEWRDHYKTNEYIPWYISIIALAVVAFGVTQLLRFLHNVSNKHVTQSIEKYYLFSEDFKFDSLTDAVAHLAKEQSKFMHKGDDIYIPVDTIQIIAKRYEASTLPLDIQYDIYLERYLEYIKEK